MGKITIGITDNSKYDVYARWIMGEPDTEVIRLGYASGNFDDVKRCHGLLLSGGDEDIHPRFYNHPEFLPLCTGGVDERRDEFELRLIDHALSNRLPLLGICRGLQIVNVYSGGTLVPDIPSKGLPNHSRFSEGHDRQHGVSVRSDSRLGAVAGQDIGGVNSAHHQAADLIGAGLIANAFSEDGVIEGLERTGKDERSFLLLVQWHPERMADQRSPLSGGVKQRFLTEIRSV